MYMHICIYESCLGLMWTCFISCFLSFNLFLQVWKITYLDRKAKYEQVIISVEDHVSCMCQSSAQKPPPSSYVPAPPSWPVHPTLPRTHSSKADLHRHDNLKHNQQHHHPQEHEARQWPQGGYTQLLRWTQPRVQQTPTHAQTGGHQAVTGMSRSVSSWPSEARAEHVVVGSVQPAGHGSGFDRSREETGGEEAHRPDHEQRQQQQRLQHQYHQQPQHPQQDNYKGEEEQEQELRTSQHWLRAPQSDSASPPVSLTHMPKVEGNPTPFPSITQKDSVTSIQLTEVTIDKQTETGKVGQKGGNEREESGSAISGDSAGPEPTNQGRERDSKVSRENGSLTEEERRQKLLEMVQTEPENTSLLHHHRHHHNHHHQQRPTPTTNKTGTAGMSERTWDISWLKWGNLKANCHGASWNFSLFVDFYLILVSFVGRKQLTVHEWLNKTASSILLLLLNAGVFEVIASFCL